MGRREVVTLLGGAAAAWPLAARAQQEPRRVAVVLAYRGGDPAGKAAIDALMQELHLLGWNNGNLRVEPSFVVGDIEQAQATAAEVVRQAPEVIVSHSNIVTAALRRSTRSIPIVFASVSDPVGSGFVASFARPGGNVTGFSNFEASIGSKWLELLKEVVPSLKRAGFMLHPETPPNLGFLSVLSAQAPEIGVRVIAIGVHDAGEIEHGIAALATEPNSGLIVAPHAVTLAHRDFIIALAQRHRLPAIYPFEGFAREGGLISFGNDQQDAFHRAATYVDRILKGQRPEDLPVQLPTKFQMVINLKTAKALGLEVPPTLLARADEVIE